MKMTEKHLIYLFLLTFLVNLSNCVINYPKIVGGEDASQGDFPFLVTIYVFGSLTCTGSLIQEDLVLTSAGCLIEAVPIEYYSVLAGAHDLSNESESGRQTVGVSEFIFPKDLNQKEGNLVGLMRLSANFTLTDRIKLINLANSQSQVNYISANKNGTIVGWGPTNASDPVAPSKILQKAIMSLVDNEICKKAYRKDFDIELQFCAGGQEADICSFDIGGPFLFDKNRILYGISSWGGLCQGIKVGSVFTKIQPYISWIREQMSHT